MRAGITAPVQRLPFVDWTRGFAVLAMVLWHTGDGWLRPPLKAGEGFFFLRFIGGLAAPSFLLLAGMAVALGARTPRDAAHARELRLANLARGFEVLLLGYLLRLQTWLLDADALRRLSTVRAWLPLACGYGALFWSARCVLHAPRRAAAWAALGVSLSALGLFQVEAVAPGRLSRLLQVDVLQAIGASLTLLAVIAPLVRRAGLLFALGVAITLATPLVWSLLPAGLPRPLAAYLGRFEPLPGAAPPALFPLFPWLAYACCGAALGRWLRIARPPVDRTVLLCMVLGACVAALTSEAHAYIQHTLNALPNTVPPLRAAFRMGIIATLLGIGFTFPGGLAGRVLVDLGRASLRVYWFHLPFAYGILGRPLRGRLGYLEFGLAASLLLLAMWGLSRARFSRKPDSQQRTVVVQERPQDQA
jgi:uncharacterized membrane protein